MIAPRFYPPWSDGEVSYSKSLLEVFMHLKNSGDEIGEIRVLSVTEDLWLRRASQNEVAELRKQPAEISYLSGLGRNGKLALCAGSRNFTHGNNSTLIHTTYSGLNPYMISLAQIDFSRVKNVVKHIYILPIHQGFMREKTFFKAVRHLKLSNFPNVSLSFSCKTLEKMYDCQKFNYPIIPPAIDTRFFKPKISPPRSRAKSILNLADPALGSLDDVLANDFLMLYMGPLTPDRFNAENILSALSQLGKSGLKLGLIAVGRGYPSEYEQIPKINALLSEKGMSKKAFICIKHLKMDEKVDLFAMTDVFLYPFFLRLESITVVLPPIALLEAMSMGKVAISGGLPGLQEVIKHGQNGLLVNGGQKLTDVLQFAIANVKDISIKARETIEKKYSVSVVAGAYQHWLKNSTMLC